MAGIVIQPPGWPAPRGYSNGILTEAGEVLAVAGQVGWDETGRIISDDFVKQFDRALSNVLTVVKAGGGNPNHIVQMRVYVVDRREYKSRERELGAIWQEKLGRYYPAMSLVEVTGLVEDGAKVEIEALAVLPPRGKGMPVPADPDGDGDDFDPPTRTVTAVAPKAETEGDDK